MCSIGARGSANCLKPVVHDVRVDEPEFGMLEDFGKAANDFEAKTFPQPNGALVGTYDEIELHGAETTLPRALQRVCTHRASHAASGRVRSGHVSAIRNVRAAAFL